MRTLISILLITLIALPALARAQDDPLAWSPTGDALWDAYAGAVLSQLAQVPETDDGLTYAGLVPQDVLDGWAERFGGDPRYWELCYWNAQSWPDPAPGDYLGHIGYLEQAEQRGIATDNTRMLLYKLRNSRLSYAWSTFEQAELRDDVLEQIGWLAAELPDEFSHRWFEDQDIALARWQAEACPGQAWAQYTLAMKQFEYGEWEAGLGALEAGNAAPEAAMPLPFPVSYYVDHTADGSGVGNEMLAGVLAGHASLWSLPNFIGIKDHVKEQELRLAMGADWREFGPWYRFSCRLGQMERATTVQQLVGVVLMRLTLSPLLINAPDELTPDQRREVLALHSRSNKVKELVKYEMKLYAPDMDNPPAALASDPRWRTIILTSPFNTDEELPDYASPPQYSLADLAAALSWGDQLLTAEFFDIAPEVRAQFAEYQQFDFETLSYTE